MADSPEERMQTIHSVETSVRTPVTHDQFLSAFEASFDRNRDLRPDPQQLPAHALQNFDRKFTGEAGMRPPYDLCHNFLPPQPLQNFILSLNFSCRSAIKAKSDTVRAWHSKSGSGNRRPWELTGLSTAARGDVAAERVSLAPLLTAHDLLFLRSLKAR
jgi:hypothetical protein